MCRNWPLGVFKVFFEQNSTFTPILDNFWKNRKKSIFCDFFTCGSPKNESVEYSTGLEYVIEYSGLQTPQNSFGKFMWPLLNPPSLRRVHFVVWPGLPKNTLTSSKLLKSLN